MSLYLVSSSFIFSAPDLHKNPIKHKHCCSVMHILWPVLVKVGLGLIGSIFTICDNNLISSCRAVILSALSLVAFSNSLDIFAIALSSFATP